MVEVIDRATWIALRRLQASGIIQIMDGGSRVLHRAAGLADTDEEDAANALKARLAALRAEAERALRMARVLATGGFPEEAMPLLAKAIGHSAAAKLAALGELAAGVTSATSAQVRDLVDRKEFPLQTTAALDVLAETSAAPLGAKIEQILKATTEILATHVEDMAGVVATMEVRCGQLSSAAGSVSV